MNFKGFKDGENLLIGFESKIAITGPGGWSKFP
ncbi:MAG: hypothetical protein ACI8UG_001302 [Gammaproteobacteria bacterium]|jgi:hypothetical protein